jgi:tRNA (guanine37-N1)-methyltransferase
VKVSCEDGRDFIRTVAASANAYPLPLYAGPQLSRAQERAQRKRQTQFTNPSYLSKLPKSCGRVRLSHFVMNLPDSAIMFLDAFRGILSGAELSEIYNEGPMPMVHCHCFTREMEFEHAEADIHQVRAPRSKVGLINEFESSESGGEVRTSSVGRCVLAPCPFCRAQQRHVLY